MKLLVKYITLSLVALFTLQQVTAQEENKVIIVIIDGARYSETFGDPDRDHVPKMEAIAAYGTIADSCYNKGITITQYAIPALWSGGYTAIIDTTYNGIENQYSELPSIFEYYRKEMDYPADSAYYVMKNISNPWLQSFDPDYGPDYWPETFNMGWSDVDVTNYALTIMQNDTPPLMWVYLADVDHAGHVGNWGGYIDAIETADEQVGRIWEGIQNSSYYRDKTTLIVTNDHGRHDEAHGGFQSHGCSCEGCQHIMLLFAGNNVKQNSIDETYCELTDMAVTAAHLLNTPTPKAEGRVLYEVLTENSVPDTQKQAPLIVVQNPISSQFCFTSSSYENAPYTLTIYNMEGKSVLNTTGIIDAGTTSCLNVNHFTKGTYIYHMVIDNHKAIGKIVKHN